MNLKESFRYQNKLNEWLDKTNSYLMYDQNVTKKEQTHMRKKSNPDAVDETIDNTKDKLIKQPVNVLVELLIDLLEQKHKLSDAINQAKSKLGIDIDGAVSLNKKKQEINSTFSRMANIKTVDRITRGQDYKFNVAGDQTPYTYEIKEVTSIDFDRNKVKAIAKQLAKEADEVSTQLDRIMVDTTVNYDPKYDVNDSYDDVLEQFAGKT